MTTDDSSNRIYLEDLDAEVRLLKRTTIARLESAMTIREQKYEVILSDIAKECMGVFTQDYIRKKIIDARVRGKSTVHLISKQYAVLEAYLDYDHSRVFYQCIGDAKESLESRIKSLIDTTSIVVTFDHDANHDRLIIDLSWGHYLYRPMFCLRYPVSCILVSFFLALSSFCFLLILSFRVTI